jgi:hypothetical protein
MQGAALAHLSIDAASLTAPADRAGLARLLTT